jgi:molybdopterin-guanine dinucleotide biosynthesis protein A
MDAVVTAGGIPQPDEALYAYSKGESKALIDIAGKPMIQWVLDALGNSQTIDRVVLIGLTDKSNLTCKKPLTYLSNQGKMLDNLKAGTAKVLELNPKAEYVLFVASDIPSIKAEMVDWVVNTCLETRDDLY